MGETRQQRRERERRRPAALREVPDGMSREEYVAWMRRRVRESALAGRLDGGADGYCMWLPSTLGSLLEHLGSPEAVWALAQELADGEGAGIVLVSLTPGRGLREFPGNRTQVPVRLRTVVPEDWSPEREEVVLYAARAQVHRLLEEEGGVAVLASEFATAPYEGERR